MNTFPESVNLQELTAGYSTDPVTGVHCCLFCGKSFTPDEVYLQPDGRFLSAQGAVRAHIMQAHGSVLSALLSLPKGDTGFTERQRDVLLALSEGKDDRQTAAQLGISSSTLRHMRFTFREKARQAQLCLAICQLALSHNPDAIMPIHKGATMTDDRYNMTQQEDQQILQTYFASEAPLILKQFPAREKKKLAVLRRISQCFTPGQRYTEPEINEILRGIYDDFPLLRRYLIEYGFLKRTRDCRTYWKEEE